MIITENYIIAATQQEMLELFPSCYKVDNYNKVYSWSEYIAKLVDHHDIPENKRAFLTGLEPAIFQNI